jgi:hypothetical protein
MEIVDELIHFIQHEDRVAGADPAQGLQDAPGMAPI